MFGLDISTASWKIEEVLESETRKSVTSSGISLEKTCKSKHVQLFMSLQLKECKPTSPRQFICVPPQGLCGVDYNQSYIVFCFFSSFFFFFFFQGEPYQGNCNFLRLSGTQSVTSINFSFGMWQFCKKRKMQILIWVFLKGHCVDLERKFKLNIHNIIEVLIQILRNIYFFHKWIKKLFSEED